MTSKQIRAFLDDLEAVDLPEVERKRANKAAGLLTRVAQRLEIEEREGKRPRPVRVNDLPVQPTAQSTVA